MLENRADTFLYRLRRAFVNPFSIILFVLAIISFSTELMMNGGYRHDFSTAIIIACMLVISGMVRLIQEMRAKKYLTICLAWLYLRTWLEEVADGEN